MIKRRFYLNNGDPKGTKGLGMELLDIVFLDPAGKYWEESNKLCFLLSCYYRVKKMKSRKLWDFIWRRFVKQCKASEFRSLKNNTFKKPISNMVHMNNKKTCFFDNKFSLQ